MRALLEAVAWSSAVGALILMTVIGLDVLRYRRALRERAEAARRKGPALCPHGIAMKAHCPHCVQRMAEKKEAR